MSKSDGRGTRNLWGGGADRLPTKARQVAESRKVWAGVLGVGLTLSLWGLGEIDGARAVEAMTWVLGIFIGAVALEDGMTRFFGTLIRAPHKGEMGKD